MGEGRHCRLCWGNCPGDCLLPGDTGMCIHGRLHPLPLRQRVQLWFVRLGRAGSRTRVSGA
jgi:hypothetical protein